MRRLDRRVIRRIIIVTCVCFGIGLAALGYLALRRPARAAQGPAIVLYSGEDFTGEKLVLADTVFDMPVTKDAQGAELNWNDEVRSIVVLGGTWRLYQHGRCNTELDESELAAFDVRTKTPAGGWSCLLSGLSTGPLELPNAAAGGFWRDISSIELVSTQNLPDWAFDLRK
jgi:hypothetical protein